MAILALLLFVVGLVFMGWFNYRHARRTARHLMSLYQETVPVGSPHRV